MEPYVSNPELLRWLNKLVPLGPGIVQNSLIDALSTWVRQWYFAPTEQAQIVQAIKPYEGWVKHGITNGNMSRRTLPPHTPLPPPYGTGAQIQALEQELLDTLASMSLADGVAFLGTLNGMWMLACPESIIRAAPEFGSSLKHHMSDEYMVFLMTRQLSLYFN